MAVYSLFFKESVQKDLDGIPKKDLRKILSRIKSLAADPRPPRCEKLTGQNRYRLSAGFHKYGHVKIPPHPPLIKGGKPSPPFWKGRLGGI